MLLRSFGKTAFGRIQRGNLCMPKCFSSSAFVVRGSQLLVRSRKRSSQHFAPTKTAKTVAPTTNNHKATYLHSCIAHTRLYSTSDASENLQLLQKVYSGTLASVVGSKEGRDQTHTAIKAIEIDLATLHREGNHCDVEIIPQWSEDCEISLFGSEDSSIPLIPLQTSVVNTSQTAEEERLSLTIRQEEQEEQTVKASEHGERSVLQARIPYNLDVTVKLHEGNVVMKGDCKLEANAIFFESRKGSIYVSKARGDQLSLLAPKGGVKVLGYIENRLAEISAETVDIKRAMADKLEIITHRVGSVNVGAVYSSQARIRASGEDDRVLVGNNHGTLRVENVGQSGKSSIILQSVNGRAFAVSDRGNVEAHIEGLEEDSGTGRDERSPDSNSACSLLARSGSVAVSTSTELKAQLLLRASKKVDIPSDGIENVTRKRENGTDATTSPQAEVVTASMLSQPATMAGGNRAKAFSQSGKIDTNAAKSSYLSTSFFSQTPNASVDVHKGKAAPTIEVSAPNGSVSVVALTWMEKVKRSMAQRTSQTH